MAQLKKSFQHSEETINFHTNTVHNVILFTATSQKFIQISPGAEGGPVCNHMSPNFDS